MGRRSRRQDLHHELPKTFFASPRQSRDVVTQFGLRKSFAGARLVAQGFSPESRSDKRRISQYEFCHPERVPRLAQVEGSRLGFFELNSSAPLCRSLSRAKSRDGEKGK